MNNDKNDLLGYDERRAESRVQANNAGACGIFPYGQMRNMPEGDLRTTPRLDTNVTSRRRCDGSLRDDGNGGSTARYGWGLHDHPLAMVFSPYQHWRKTYTPEVALAKGTLFSELDLPLEVTNCRRGC